MNNRFIKKSLIILAISTLSLTILPAQASPEVDLMNRCDTPVKVTRQYTGEFRGWDAHDNYINYRNDSGYYERNYCPEIKAAANQKSAIKKASTGTPHNSLYKTAQAAYTEK